MLSLFGMMNWIYTWHNPRRRCRTPRNLAEQMADIFLRGVCADAGAAKPRHSGKRGMVQQVQQLPNYRRIKEFAHGNY